MRLSSALHIFSLRVCSFFFLELMEGNSAMKAK